MNTYSWPPMVSLCNLFTKINPKLSILTISSPIMASLWSHHWMHNINGSFTILECWSWKILTLQCRWIPETLVSHNSQEQLQTKSKSNNHIMNWFFPVNLLYYSWLGSILALAFHIKWLKQFLFHNMAWPWFIIINVPPLWSSH